MTHYPVQNENELVNVSEENGTAIVASQKVLLELGHYLQKLNYRFITITPESHHLVLARDIVYNEVKHSFTEQVLRDFFGWNRLVLKKNIPLPILSLISEANAVINIDSLYLQSKIRFSTISDNLFLHSSFPTSGRDAVFFGPDTYRFVKFLKNKIKAAKVIIDLGCGPGTGGIVLSNLLNQNKHNQVKKLYLGDINQTALDFARVNVALNKVNNAELILSNMLDNIPKGADLIIANPPFIMDADQRTYRHGGDNYGSQLSVHIVQSALEYLKTGGVLALYTGSCVIQGKDIFFEQIQPLLNCYPINFEYEEIDCDIFGEELMRPIYADVDRIAAVTLLVTKY